MSNLWSGRFAGEPDKAVFDWGKSLPIDRRFAKGWELMAISGGAGIGVMGEWDGQFLRPLAAMGGGEFVPLRWILAAEAEAA